MSITLQPELQAKLRDRANEAGITVEAYIERLVRADETDYGAMPERLEALASEGVDQNRREMFSGQ